MTDERKKNMMEESIIASIRQAPESPVPDGFAERVMGGLAPKRPSLWMRLKMWLISPRSMTFRPLHAIPVAAVAVALLAFALVRVTSAPVADGPHLSTVRFVMYDTQMKARNVSVIGTFNDWKAERSAMRYSVEAGAWILEAQLPQGDHEYLFLVNGEQLVPDPLAPLTRDDGFGNRNSIMFVNGEHGQIL